MNKLRPNTLALIVGLAAVPLLTGCFPVVAGGVAVGVMAATDRRMLSTQTADEEIELKAAQRLLEKFGDKVHVNVISYNRKVLLVGEATSAALKAEVNALVRSVPNIDGISDEVIVGATSSLTARSNDAYITGKVKARFIEANKFNANHVKVVTDGGAVYLLGLVTEREGKAAIEVARTTAGVRKVITLLETISEAQAKALDNRPDAATPPAATPAPPPSPLPPPTTVTTPPPAATIEGRPAATY